MKRGKRKPAKRPARVRTALATREQRPADVPVALVPTTGSGLASFGEDQTFGALGLVDLKVTPEEERILAEPVPVSAIRVKPTSSGQVYLSHPDYTRWFNRAFGRTGWALRPVSAPMRQGSTVGMSFILFVHGQPVAAAFGEQEYHESNKEQTYGDAIESTYASALRRCAKRLGVGLELWDRDYTDRFLADHCVLVWVKDYDGKTRPKWRRRSDPPFRGEQRGREEQKPVEPPEERYESEEPITAEQAKRLWTIARRRGRTDEEVMAYLKRCGYASTADIKMRAYTGLCDAIKGEGSLL